MLKIGPLCYARSGLTNCGIIVKCLIFMFVTYTFALVGTSSLYIYTHTLICFINPGFQLIKSTSIHTIWG